jgi:DNA-binding transcriptional LysR family regulator
MGTPLLRRSGRTLRMTHAGAVFKPHLDALLHHLDDGVAAVNQLIDPDTGTVALAFQQSLGTWLVPDLARSFRAAHPGVGFQLTQVRDELNAAALAGGNADLELGSRRPSDEQTHTRLITLEPLRLPERAVRREWPRPGRLSRIRAAPAGWAEVEAWRHRWFTAGNALLWVSGTVPRGLRLDLPPGPAPAAAPLRPLGLTLPGFAPGARGGIGLSLTGRLSDASS